MNVDVDPSFGVFAGGELHADGVSSLGGATLAQGVALDDWVPVAVVQLRANVDLPGAPRIELAPTFDGVSGYGQGTVPEDRIRFVPLALSE